MKRYIEKRKLTEGEKKNIDAAISKIFREDKNLRLAKQINQLLENEIQNDLVDDNKPNE